MLKPELKMRCGLHVEALVTFLEITIYALLQQMRRGMPYSLEASGQQAGPDIGSAGRQNAAQPPAFVQFARQASRDEIPHMYTLSHTPAAH